MNVHKHLTVSYRRVLVACLATLALTTTTVPGSSDASTDPAIAPASGDGQHDFDWELGTWQTKVRVLAEPLSETEDEWLRFQGTSIVRPLMDRRANIIEFEVSGPSGRIEALNLRLYEPAEDRWSLTFVNLRDGLLTPSVSGRFHQGVGEFHGDDQLGGRPIKVRFLVFRLGADKARFEQAFSDDGGQTWETNWVAVDRRVHH